MSTTATATGTTTNSNKKKQSPQSKPKNNQSSSSSSSSSSKQKHKKKKSNGTTSDKKKSFLKSLQNTLQTIDPFEAGYQFRRELTSINRELNSAITTFTGVRSDVDAEHRILPENLYYLSDRLFALETSTNSKEEEDELLPEILVVGAVTKIGIIVVKKLLLKGMRVRVLVPNLYSSTLNLLGTNVVYFQGDLSNVESLEYALTDVDKIVFCEGDEISTEMDPENYTTINSSSSNRSRNGESGGGSSEDVDWMGMQKLLHAYQNVRFADYGAGQAAKRSLFKLKDRPEDFNLFAIDQEEEQQPQQEEEEESESESDWEEETNKKSKQKRNRKKHKRTKQNALWCRWMKNKFDHGVFIGSVSAAGNTIAGGQGEAAIVSTRLRARRKKTPPSSPPPSSPPPSSTTALSSNTTTETTTTTSNDNGIDLSRGFAGFVCRLCGDGKKYEAFVRTGDYDKYGIEYVHEFQTVTKPVMNNTKPPMETTNSGRERAGKARRDLPKFITVRMPFKEFAPRLQNPEVLEAVLENEKTADNSACFVLNFPPFDGKDVRHIGFRFRSSANDQQSSSSTQNNKSKLNLSRSALNTLASNSNTPQSTMPTKQFYLALCYIKLFRANYEPEFVYLSDSRIPPKVTRSMVRHDVKMILSSNAADENDAFNGDQDNQEDGDFIVSMNGGGQTHPNAQKQTELLHHDLEKEKPYYKYRGEQLLRNSGLSYSIVRVPDFNESPSSEISTIQLQQTNENLISSVSRADVAEVCAACLLDPTACNVAFYVNKATRGDTRLVGNNGASSISSLDEDMSAKFARLSADL